MERKNGVHHNVQYPAEGNGEDNIFWSFSFEITPTRVHGTDCDVPEDAQEAGDENGHTPAHSLNVQNKFASKVIEEMLQPKSCHCLGNTFRENDQGVGYNQVPENFIFGC